MNPYSYLVLGAGVPHRNRSLLEISKIYGEFCPAFCPHIPPLSETVLSETQMLQKSIKLEITY